MIRMDFINHEPPTELETEMLRFVNDKIADLVLYHIDVARDCDGENLEDVFPKRYYLNNKKKCELVIHELYDTLCSDVLYHELIPIHRYVLFQVLEAYNQFCEYASDAPEFTRFELPEALKKRIYQEIINTPEYEALYGADDDDFEDLHGGVGDDEKPFLIECLECPALYIDNCFDDTDFLEENLRELAEAAMGRDPIGFLSMMDYEELDQYIDLMPGDVADRYVAFRRELDQAIKNDAETAIVNAIFSALSKIQRRIIHFKQLDEVQLTAELDDIIQDSLASEFGVHTKREYNMGRALKKLGETDLYFFKFQDGGIKDLAVLENKEIDRFVDQYYQLMGYLNPNFQFGITVSINRSYTLYDARERIFELLKSLNGEFSPEEIHFFNQHDNALLSKHIVPETGKIMFVYHFIMNLEDESRENAARKARHS